MELELEGAKLCWQEVFVWEVMVKLEVRPKCCRDPNRCNINHNKDNITGTILRDHPLAISF